MQLPKRLPDFEVPLLEVEEEGAQPMQKQQQQPQLGVQVKVRRTSTSHVFL